MQPESGASGPVACKVLNNDRAFLYIHLWFDVGIYSDELR